MSARIAFVIPQKNPIWTRVRPQAKYKYQLEYAWSCRTPLCGMPVSHRFFSVLDCGTLSVNPGYQWDGPSGLTIDTPNFIDASLPHDVLYQAFRQCKPPRDGSYGIYSPEHRLIADKLLYFHCRHWGNMVWLRAQWVYRFVRIFGIRHARPSG